jgi:hypothetical protein
VNRGGFCYERLFARAFVSGIMEVQCSERASAEPVCFCVDAAPYNVIVLTGSLLSAEMGLAHRPPVSIIQPDFLPDACGPRAHYRRKGYGHSIKGAA